MNTRHALVHTEIGNLTLVATGDDLVGVYFPQHWTRPSRADFGPQIELLDGLVDDALLERARTQLVAYLSGERTSFELPTAAAGEQFQQRVWALLDGIGFGETATYGELADKLGDRSLAYLVGQAVAQNPLSIIVPCHRVVGKGGKLTGYAGGLARKQFLLDLEAPAAVAAGRLF